MSTDTSLDNPTSYTGDNPSSSADTLDAITFTDHERVDELQDYYPVNINSPQQIHGFTSEKEAELVRCEADLIMIVGKVARGRTNIRNYYDEKLGQYESHREIARGINGFERSEVTTSRKTQTTYTVPIKAPGVVDRFLARMGRKRVQ